ncbi:MAG TPA: hypothetical protein VGE21_11140 [Flavobacteriales bacterium]
MLLYRTLPITRMLQKLRDIFSPSGGWKIEHFAPFALILGLISLVGVVQGQTTLVNYDFNSGSSYATLAPALASNITCAASSTEAFTTFGGVASGAGAFTVNGTAGQALAMDNSSGTNTKYFQFLLGGSAIVNYGSFKVYFQAQRSGTGAQTVTLQYSINGGTYTTFASNTMAPGNGSFAIATITLPAAANNPSTSMALRLLTSGASGSGTLRIDNFQVQGTLMSSASITTTADAFDGPYCNTASNALSGGVAYTTTGTFSGGNFRVQLSSASGVFPSNATSNIISSGNGLSSPIAATIPSGQAAGTGYRVRVVYDATTAVLSSNNNGSNIIVSTAPSAPTVSVTQPTCSNANGTVQVTSSLTGLTFSSDGSTYTNTTGTFSFPAGSSYTITARNANGCTSSATTGTLNAQPTTPAAPTVSEVQPTCSNANGTVQVTSSLTGLSFSSDGSTYTNTTGAFSFPAGSSYSITARNASGCISSAATGTLDAQPAGPDAPTVFVTQATCNDASATVQVTSTLVGLHFSKDGVDYSNTDGLFTLSAGTNYSITAKDDVTGCISAATTGTLDAQPAGPAAPTVFLTQPTCTDATGTVQVTSSLIDLLFSNDGVDYSNSDGTFVLPAGSSYSITAQDLNGCRSAATSGTLDAQPSTPSAPSVSVTEATCANANGSVQVTSSLTGLHFSTDGVDHSNTDGLFVLPAGSSYSITAQDIASGCISAATTGVLAAQPVTPVVSCGSYGPVCINDGDVTLGGTPVGGTWSGTGVSGTGPYVFSPSAGTRTLTYLYNNGECSDSCSTTITVNTTTTWYPDTDGDGHGDASSSLEACIQPDGYVALSDDGCPDDINKLSPGACGCNVADVAHTYYADVDGDGFGDPNTPIPGYTCITPSGAVDNATDECPSDDLKRTPGLCGCGTVDVDTNNNGICDSEESFPSVKLGLEQDPNGQLLFNLLPDGNYTGILSASVITVRWPTTPGVSVTGNSAAFVSPTISNAAGSLNYDGLNSDGTYSYATFTTIGTNSNLGADGFTANTEKPFFRVPYVNTSGNCVDFEVMGNTYQEDNNLVWFISLSGYERNNGYISGRTIAKGYSSAVCRDTTVALDATGHASIVADDVNGAAYLNCDATGSSLSTSTFDCTQAGANNVTLTVTYANGYAPTCVAVVTVIDTIAPIIANAAGSLDTTVACTDEVPVADNGTIVATDNCTPVNITSSDVTVAGSCDHRYTITRTYTVQDPSNNSSTFVQTITVNDTIAPVIANAAGSLDATVSCAADVPAANNAAIDATDNCSGPITITSNDVTNAGSCANNFSVTRTYTATDACGNASTFIQTITVNDNIAPVITNGPGSLDVTVSCAADVPAANQALIDATDNCGGTVTISSGEVTSPGSCANNFTVTRTYTATDACGNAATFVQTITVNDTIAPVISNAAGSLDTTVSCAAEVPAANQALINATDNCGGTVTITSGEVTNAGSCANNFSVTRTYTATDACGNASTFVQTITVNDTIAPVISTIAGSLNVTVSCAAGVPAANNAAIEATDNCSGSITITSNDVTNVGSCANNFTVTRTYTATDACGNNATFVQTITVNDTIAPVITNVAGSLDATVSCAAEVPVANTAAIDATDNCSGSITITSNDVTNAGSCANNFTVTRTYTATDACGNTATFVQTITVNDTIAPVVSNAAGSLDTTVSCAAAVPATNHALINTTDNCGGTVTITSSEMTIPGSCANNFMVIRTYTATDACGNTATFVQTITVNDTIAPVFANVAGSLNVTVSCAADVPVADNVLIDATDNCGGTVILTSNDVTNAGSCANQFTVTRTYTATDACGNASTFVQTITVNDTTAPVISNNAGSLDVTVSCAADVPAANHALINATDNCGGTVTISSGEVSNPGSCANQFTVTRTYTATDACGNASTFVQTITVNDTIAPVISTVAGSLDATVSCAADVPAANNATIDATDNCTGAVAITSNDVTTAGSCANNFTVIRTYTATDACGNTATFVQTITVNDTIAPVISTVAGSLDATVSCVADVPAANNTLIDATDNCAGAVIITSNDVTDAGSCANSFTVTRTYTATDACGNASTFVQTITVNDTIAPVIANAGGSLNITVSCATDVPAANNTAIDATDNCSGSITITSDDVTTAGGCPNNFTVTRTYTATDACGNTATFVQIITVNDTIAPVVTNAVGSLNVTVSCSDLSGIDAALALTPAATDNCTGATSINLISDVTGPANGCGYVRTRTWNFTDVCGNVSADFTQVIQVTSVVSVDARVFLDGPYDADQDRMSDALRVAGLVPASQPYSAAPWSYSGSETVGAAVLNNSDPDDAIVDWVLLELRNDLLPTTVVARRAALVQRDGDIVDVDGTSAVGFNVPEGTYRVAIRHRNHLGAMTLNGFALSYAPTAVDLTSTGTPTYGTTALTVHGARQALWSGNVVTDNKLRYTGSGNDRDTILVRVGGLVPTNVVTNVYTREDVNMDGLVKYTGIHNDRDPILVNIGGNIPTAQRFEQLP